MKCLKNSKKKMWWISGSQSKENFICSCNIKGSVVCAIRALIPVVKNSIKTYNTVSSIDNPSVP